MQGTEDTGPAGEPADGPDGARGAEGVAPGRERGGGQDQTGGQDAARTTDDEAHRPGHPAAARPHEDHGPVRYGPPAPDPGLPVLPELAAVLAAAADRTRAEPLGGGRTLCEAARGYWDRRGLHGGPENIVAAPGDQPLLLALIAAHGGDVLMPRPCPATWMPQARLLGRPAYQVPTPAECGGVPDPYALLETVRRVRAEG
ncbi:pyridoxal phosphate-dependent aminotransferase, partial [Streptomyces rubiginosohelvolus]